MMSEQFSELFKILNGNDKSNGYQLEEFSAEKILTLLNNARLDRAFVLSGSYILGMNGIEGPDEYNDVKKENNYLAIQCAKYPEGLVGFFSVNPLKDYAIEEMDRCYDELKLPNRSIWRKFKSFLAMLQKKGFRSWFISKAGIHSLERRMPKYLSMM